jgi:F-type H+-transporting ATPase subunit b
MMSVDQGAHIAETFGVEWPLLAAQMLSFSIVCALLYVLVYKPVLRVLHERRRQILKGLANTEKLNAALAAIEDQQRQTIAAAQAEAARLIAEARNTASRLKERERHLAVAHAEQILQAARDAAEQEHRRALAEAQRDIGRLVTKTTAMVAGNVLTSEDQRRLVDEILKELTAA